MKLTPGLPDVVKIVRPSVKSMLQIPGNTELTLGFTNVKYFFSTNSFLPRKVSSLEQLLQKEMSYVDELASIATTI